MKKTGAQTTVLTHERFEKAYQPQMNSLNKRAELDGRMYETYGAEAEHVLKTLSKEPGRVWTVMENCDIRSGHHTANRLGHIITKRAVPDGATVLVTDGE